MKKQFEETEILNNLLGFSQEHSIQKSYYPQLQSKIHELEHEKSKYFNLFNNISDALFITNKSGIIMDLNIESIERFEYSKSELLNRSIFTLVDHNYHHNFHHAIESKFYINLEICQHTKSGKAKYSSVNIQPIEFDNAESLLFVCRDITDKKLFEMEIAKVQSYINDIFNSMPSIIISINEKCKITQCNKNAEEWLNRRLNEIANQKIFEIVPLLKDFENIICTSIVKMEILSNIKLKQTTNNIETIYEITIFPLHSSKNGAVIRIDDISEKVNLEKMIIQSEKMLSIGGLAAGMAHEINNPLAGMIQNANVLKNRLVNNLEANDRVATECNVEFENIQQYVSKRNIDKLLSLIIESGQNAAEIVRNMLNFARNNDLEKSPHILTELIDESIDLATHDYDIHKRYDFKKINIVKNYDHQTPVIMCNRSQLQQVFFNLCKNSMEAFFECQTEDKNITVNINQNDTMLIIEFIDNGPGIPDEIIKKVFDPFFTTKGPGFGTGLGLFVSYYIITENHNGTIEVERIKPQGTKFIIKLPIRDDKY